MVLQENEIIYKYFSMSLYQKLPENAAVISIYIYMQPLTSSLWIINTISLFFIIPHKKKKVMDYIALSHLMHSDFMFLSV